MKKFKLQQRMPEDPPPESGISEESEELESNE